MRLLLALVVATLAGCSGHAPPAWPLGDTRPLDAVGLVVDHQPAEQWRPLLMTEPGAQPLGPTQLRFHDGSRVHVSQDVSVRGWCYELGDQRALEQAAQCYLAYRTDGTALQQALLLRPVGRDGTLARAADQDRFTTEPLGLTATWHGVRDGIAELRTPEPVRLRLAVDVDVDCRQDETGPEALHRGYHVQVVLDRATAQITSVACLYSD